MATKAQFGSKIGLIAATVGSAVGLGNIWRFPAETQSNGGAAFLLLYIVCVFILGIPVMLAEFSLGRGCRSDAVGVFRLLSPGKKWWIVGAVAILASYLILSFYMVVAGWTAEYLWQSVTGALYEVGPGAASASPEALDARFQGKMQEYILTDVRPIVMTYIMLLVNLGILLMGVRKGIEKMSNILMPVLFLLLLLFAGVSLSLPKASEGLEFFLNPDFSKITPTVLDNHDLAGTALVFVTLPEVFVQMPWTQFWSILFFTLLLVAALTSTISLAEVSIAFMQSRFGMKRSTACLVVMLPLFVLSALCSLSLGSLSSFTIAGLTLFDFLDNTATNIMLPLVAISTCIYMGWFAPKKYFREELTNGNAVSRRFYKPVLFVVRYVAPVLIAAILLAKIF